MIGPVTALKPGLEVLEQLLDVSFIPTVLTLEFIDPVFLVLQQLAYRLRAGVDSRHFKSSGGHLGRATP